MTASRSSDDDVSPAARPGGPIDGNAWASKLTARVVDPGPPARIHGYEVDADLALHYRYTDLLRLALVGELPSAAVRRAFDFALQLLAPIDVGSAPAHAGVLARTCGARSSAIVGVAALALAEQAHHLVAAHAELLAWLDAPHAAFPAAFLATTPEDIFAAGGILAATREAGLEVSALDARPSRIAALLAVLHACGLRRPEQMEAALVIARMPCVLAESFAATAGAFKDYPMLVPPFRREEIR